MKPYFVSTRAIEAYVASDGQRFTGLIRSWANVYLRRNGAANFSINGVSWRPDGGVDGLIDDAAFSDPLGWFGQKTVMQFKAGSTSGSDAKAELLKEPQTGSLRIRDKVVDGFKVVWFVGRGLPDLERVELEAAIDEIVTTINSDAPQPLVIDANRLADLLSLTPAVALSVSNNHGLFNTTTAALLQTPHDKLKVFVPGSHYETFRKDIVQFLTGASDDEPIKYVAGEPGIGKSRSILEAVEASPELRGTVCYFESPGRVAEFFTLAKQDHWRGAIVIDEYIGESRTTLEISEKTVPSGMKVLLIGHAYETNRLSREVSNKLDPLSDDEIKNALAATFTDLPEFRIREAVQMSRQNIRLARLICEYFSRNPNALELDVTTLDRIVTAELRRMPTGQDVLLRLSLLPNLLSEETAEFCALVEYDEQAFRKTCKQISASSALIQYNDHVAYIGSPAVAQLALIRLWNEHEDLVRRILNSAGGFGERMLVSINRLPPCPEKEAMLSFFFLPIADLKLTDLLDPTKGTRFLHLLTADPETYLPVLHRLVMDARGQLDQFPYEGTRIGRRDVIWRLRDLAQFSAHFDYAEEIVYAFAREEVPSAYANVASSFWSSWFSAYFDFTVFPYEKRLELLEKRALTGDYKDRELVLKAISDPFPHTGDMPSRRVGGRIAPPELNFIHHHQVRLAAQRIPDIVRCLIQTETLEFQAKVADTVIKACFSWLEHGALQAYAAMVNDPSFPPDARKHIVANVRHYVDLGKDRTIEPNERANGLRSLHEELLAKIDETDPFITALEVASHGFWQGEETGSEANRKLTRLVEQCLEDRDLLERTVDLLSDPVQRGGGSFGRLLGAKMDEEAFEYILARVRLAGLSQFSHSALVASVSAEPSRERRLMEFAKDQELNQPLVAVSIYRLLGEETYFEESARLLTTSAIPSQFFRGFFLQSGADLSANFWAFVEAIASRARSGDDDAIEALTSMVSEFARLQVKDNRAYAHALLALENSTERSLRNSLAEWSDIALWAYKQYSTEVIAIAAEQEQSEFSSATVALAEIAKQEPEAVLDALVPKLAHPYSAPFLLSGALAMVFQNISIEVFDRWLRKQKPLVVQTVPAHLPKPFLKDGKAIVPDLTRTFWNFCLPALGETYKTAQANFAAHTFDTDVYWGHGVELFRDRVEIGKQLLNDPNPGMRAWAEDFVKQSEYSLQDAIRSSRIDDARRATDE